MIQNNSFKTGPFYTTPLAQRILTGWVIGLVVILFFILPANKNPEWSTYWMLRPLLITPLAGAMAGVFYHYTAYWRQKNGPIKIATYLANILVYAVGLWLGIVLGLDGTLWN